MIRHDYTGCGVCHADPSGAGLLTDYGRAQSVLLMQMHYGEPPKGDEAPKYADFAFGVVPLPEWLLAQVTYRGAEFILNYPRPPPNGGAAVQTTDVSYLQMLLDARAELKLGVFRAAGALGWSNTPYTAQAVVVSNTDYTNQLVAREYWLGVQLADDTLLLRLGRINLPFGLRNVEHTAWVRQQTATTINVDQQSGFSVSFDNSKVRTEIMAMFGNLNVSPDSYRERGLSGLVEVPVAERTVVGLSALISRAGQNASSNGSAVLRQVYGAHTRWSPVEPVVLLAEADVYLNDVLGSGNTQANGVGWLQADYEPIQGLHFQPALEALQQYGVSGMAVGTWLTVDWFCLPHTEFRVDGLWRNSPSPGGRVNVFSLLLQLHVYL